MTDSKPSFSLLEILTALLVPWHFMLVALSYLPGTIVQLFKFHPSLIFSWPHLQDAWFGSFWSWAGPRIREGRGPTITALLEGRVSQARVHERPVAPPVGGVVLDLGPGMGYWVDLYASINVPKQMDAKGDGLRARSTTGNTAAITKVYGVEPNRDVHDHLRSQASKAGLDDIYEILPVGIQNLASTNKVQKGSVDCIVSLLCLCSIPEPEENIKELYGLLKKGGRWYFYEHVHVSEKKGGWLMRGYQGTA